MTQEKVCDFGNSLLAKIVASTLYAEKHTECQRKGVAALLIKVEKMQGEQFYPRIVLRDINGPLPGVLCEGPDAVGSCGCGHAEPRLMLDMLGGGYHGNSPFIIATSYSPCTQCANIIAWVHAAGIIKGLVYGKLTEHDKRGLAHLQHIMPCYEAEELIVRPTAEHGKVIEEQWI